MDAQEYRNIFQKILAFPERKYNAKTGAYVIPVTAQNVVYLEETFHEDEYDTDEIAGLEIQHVTKTYQLQKIKEKRRLFYRDTEEEVKIKYDFVLPPYRHQAVATDSLHGAEYFALLMEMGTGKTKVVIDEICWVGEGVYVIVCPKSVRGQWIKELIKHATKPYFVTLMKSRHKGVKQLIEGVRAKQKIKIFIIGFDMLKTMGPYLAKLKPSMTVLDESHCIKNKKTKRTEASKVLGAASARRVILTGTPVANTLLDLWSQFDYLNPGCLGYMLYGPFKTRFAKFKRMESGFEKLVGYKHVDELKKFMSLCSFVAKKKDCLDLPPKIYEVRYVEMQPKQREIYEKMLAIALADLEGDLSPSGTVSATAVIVQLLRLAQIANGFVKTLDGTVKSIPGGNPKLEVLKEVIEGIHPDEKIVIWARFHKDVDNIMELLAENGISYVTLTGRTRNRDESVDSFNSSRGARVLIGEPGSGGCGIDLLGTEAYPCTTHIYYSNDFSALKRAQSEDRSHRIGMFRPIIYIDLMCEDSIEERIYKILKSKRELNETMTNYSSVKELLTGKAA